MSCSLWTRNDHPANTRCPNVVLMLDRCLRRWVTVLQPWVNVWCLLGIHTCMMYDQKTEAFHTTCAADSNPALKQYQTVGCFSLSNESLEHARKLTQCRLDVEPTLQAVRQQQTVGQRLVCWVHGKHGILHNYYVSPL